MGKKTVVAYDDGAWHASTLGHLISFLVDSGDPAVAFRVHADSEPDEAGKFTRHIEIVLIPNGLIANEIQGCRTVHKTLAGFLERGAVQ